MPRGETSRAPDSPQCLKRSINILMSMHTLTIVGVGLIGGSIGLAAKKRGLAKNVLGVGRNQSRLDQARHLGAIDESCLDLAAAAGASDLVVVCTPVDRIAEYILAMAPYCRPGTLLTDAGSTKETIVAGVEEHWREGEKGRRGEREKGTGDDETQSPLLPFSPSPLLPNDVHFVGSHPLAGSEKQGVQYADADCFQGRWTIVTRTSRTDVSALDRVMTFWQQLGSRVKIMDPVEHDRALATTSHLPHLLAAALAGILPREWHDLTATGFRDSTRIAAGDPELWSAIFAHNRDALLAALARFEEQLGSFKAALQGDDWNAVKELLSRAKKSRDGLNG